MNKLEKARQKKAIAREYLNAPHCSVCKSKNVYYRQTTNDYLCRRCGAKTIGNSDWRKEK